MTLLAEVVSGDTAVSISLGILVLGLVVTCVRMVTILQHRLDTNERVSERQQSAIEKCQTDLTSQDKRVSTIESDLYRRSPHRSDVWPTVGSVDR
jgi:hypothetical protein